MRIICGLLLCIILMQASKGLAVETQSEKYLQLENDCGVYTYHIVKPMLEYFNQVNPKIAKNDEELENKNNRIKELEEKVEQLQMQITNPKSQIDSIEDTLCYHLCVMENKKFSEVGTATTSDSELIETDATETADENQEILEFETEPNGTEQPIEIKKETNCLSKTPPGVHNISLQNDITFEILTNSDIAGPGWIIIQQRIRGGVDFYRNFEEYTNGFGDFWDGDFFLGLEKIYLLTNEEPYELCIHMHRYDGEIFIAMYDEFAISSEYYHYRLDQLGKFSGNTTDELGYHKSMPFSTYESSYCTRKHHGGWWYDNCAKCNLNGQYFKTGRWAAEGIFWQSWLSLKEVRMMIRPKSECS